MSTTTRGTTNQMMAIPITTTKGIGRIILQARLRRNGIPVLTSDGIVLTSSMVSPQNYQAAVCFVYKGQGRRCATHPVAFQLNAPFTPPGVDAAQQLRA